MKTRAELKVARIRAGMSQHELAVYIRVSQQTIAKWELGITTPSHFSHIRGLERILNTPAETMFPDIFQQNQRAIRA